MYFDAAKTLVAASGIAVALLAFSASTKTVVNPLVALSAKVAVVCLISCVCWSLIVILALLRGFQHSEARHMDEERDAGRAAIGGQGKLNESELLSILFPTCIALSCFLVGFAFLGRIAFHV